MNKDLLARVWQNLLGNAVKFVPTGGTIRITLGHTEQALSVCVADNGPGIRGDDRPLPFIPSYSFIKSSYSCHYGYGYLYFVSGNEKIMSFRA